MKGQKLIWSSAVLGIAALAAVAYQLGRGRSGEIPVSLQTAIEERLTPLDGIEGRLQQLQGEVASLRGALAEDAESAKGKAPPEAERLAALESSLAALQLRVNGLEQDPIRRGESFLESENAEMRREGINTLRRVARFDPKTRAAFRGLLHDPSERVREQAAQMLRDLRDKESEPEMKALLSDSDARTRRRAVEALGAMEARDAVPELGRTLATDADDRVRVASADALGRLKAPEAAEFLVAALKDRNEMVRGEAIAALGEINAVSAAPLLRAIYDQDPGNHRVRLVLALKSLGDDAPLKREVARLSEILRSETDARSRQQAQRELDMLNRQ